MSGRKKIPKVPIDRNLDGGGFFVDFATDGHELAYLPVRGNRRSARKSALGNPNQLHDTVEPTRNIPRRVYSAKFAPRETCGPSLSPSDVRIYETKSGTRLLRPRIDRADKLQGTRYFLSTRNRIRFFRHGRTAFRDQEGTWRDAEDGEFAAERHEGSVISTLGVHLNLEPGRTGNSFLDRRRKILRSV